MQQTLSPLVLRAKQLDLDGIRHLTDRVELVGTIGRLIHALQHERGASSIYLASAGQQFAAERQAAVGASQPIESQIRQRFLAQAQAGAGATSATLSLMAWVLLDLDALETLRQQIDQRQMGAHDAVAAYSRLIAGAVELIFHLAEATGDAGMSRLLVALVHLVQGKEYAGQERAVGAQLLASGQSEDAAQQRVVQLIDAQDRCLSTFEEFAEPEVRARWQQHQLTPNVAQLERLRRTLCTTRPGAALDAALSPIWFDTCSERMAVMGAIEEALVEALRQHGQARLQTAQQELQDAESLLQKLRDNPPPHTDAVGRFFRADSHPEAPPLLSRNAPSESDLEALLRTQSERLAAMEAELDKARRTLHERKIIERAKGALMSRMGLTEEAAFRALQKASMDHNRRLLDVAEATLALPDFVFSQENRTPKRSG